VNVLALLRRTRGLSQEDVSRAVGIRQKTLSEYERGLRPTPVNLIKLAQFFHVPEQDAPRLMREAHGDLIEDLPRVVLEHVG